MLLSSEGAARLLFDPPRYLLQHVFDPELGHRGPSNIVFDAMPDPEGLYSHRTNSAGFRSPELPREPPPPGTKRVLFIGDSFCDGWGVRAEALMPFSCQAELIARGHRVDTFNASYAAIGTAQELLLFRRHGPSARPDVVVLALFEGNDISDNTPELGTVRLAGGPFDVRMPTVREERLAGTRAAGAGPGARPSRSSSRSRARGSSAWSSPECGSNSSRQGL